VKSVHQVIRKSENVHEKLNYIKEVNLNRGLDFKEEIRECLSGQCVVTSYNNSAYRIDDVCFDKSPDSTFSLRKNNQEF